MTEISFSTFVAAGEVAVGAVLNEGVVAIGGASAQSAVVDPSAASAREHRRVRVFADNTCYVAFGLNPTATTTSMKMAAEQTEYFFLEAGWKIAVLDRV